jgi:hypothetical protein
VKALASKNVKKEIYKVLAPAVQNNQKQDKQKRPTHVVVV